MITAAEMPTAARRLTPHVNAVLLAMANAELERERIDKMERAVLTREDGSPMYRVAQEWLDRGMTGVPEWITDPKHAYLMADDDMADYHAECQHHIKKMGYNVPEGHCPALIAENLQIQAERALMLAAEEFFPEIPADALYLDKRRKYLDLLIGMVVNAPASAALPADGAHRYPGTGD